MIPSNQADRQAMLEIYKLTVEMADRVSGRRNFANSFFLTLHATLATIVGVLSSARESNDSGPLPQIDTAAVIWMSIAGVVLACSWWVLLQSYRYLNSAKFKAINELEKNLPTQPFTYEWACLKACPKKRWRLPYAELGFVERIIPVVFAVGYIVLAVRAGMGDLEAVVG